MADIPRSTKMRAGKIRRPTLGKVSIRGIEFLLSKVDMEELYKTYTCDVVQGIEQLQEYIVKHHAWSKREAELRKAKKAKRVNQ